MIIRIILIITIAGILLWLLAQGTSTRGQAWNKLIGLIALIFGIVAIIFPTLTTRVAHLVGVGRGTDLLLYCLTVIFMMVTLTQYMHRKEDQQKIIKLSRHIALLEANHNRHNSK
jgi:small membrane protein